MTAAQIRLARAMALNGAIDLSGVNNDCLIGCGCGDWVQVPVTLQQVAKLMRWQYLCFDGSWDDRLWADELWIYQKRIRIAEAVDADLDVLRDIVAKLTAERLTAPSWVE